MIATMMSGATGSCSRAAESVSSQIVKVHSEVRRPFVTSDLTIDGGLGLSVARRKTLPVILLPLFSECGEALQGIVDSVYRLQQACLEFRVVVATDMTDFKLLRPYGWAISHVQSEMMLRRSQWLDYAQKELKSLVESFGCSYVIETSECGISGRSWIELLKIGRVGLDLPNHSAKNPMSGSDISVHGSWRGWANGIPKGYSNHSVHIEDAEWHVTVNRNPASSMVLVRIGAESIGGDVPEVVRDGWSFCTINRVSGGAGLPAISVPGISAFFDALSLGDVGILQLDDGLRPYIDSLPASILRTCTVSSADVRSAERRALATWASISYGLRRA